MVSVEPSGAPEQCKDLSDCALPFFLLQELPSSVRAMRTLSVGSQRWPSVWGWAQASSSGVIAASEEIKGKHAWSQLMLYHDRNMISRAGPYAAGSLTSPGCSGIVVR